MKITDVRYDAIMLAVRKATYEKNYEISTLDLTGVKKFGVNWSAMGTRSVEETKAFAEDLVKGAELAEFLTSFELEVDYDADDNRIKTNEDFEQAVDFMTYAIMNDCYREIIRNAIEK